MVDTRSSPSRRKRGGKPPLPTRNSKKGKGPTKKAPAAPKTSGKATSKAKQQVVDEAGGQVYVKAEIKSGAGNFTDEEDIYLCKAWVSCSTDPVIGAEQKGEKFWKNVHDKMYSLYNEEAEVAMQTKRPWDSIRNRFQKTLGPNVQKFNAHCKQAVEKKRNTKPIKICILALVRCLSLFQYRFTHTAPVGLRAVSGEFP